MLKVILIMAVLLSYQEFVEHKLEFDFQSSITDLFF